MRIRNRALTVLLTMGALPSVPSAQVILQQPPLILRAAGAHVDRAVPVAILSRVGQPMALTDARTVQDAGGEPFVIGAATLDVDAPFDPKIVFTMTNATPVPISWKTVRIAEYGVWHDKRGLIVPAFDGIAMRDGHRGMQFPGIIGSLSAWAARDGVSEPGTAITIELPIAQIPREGEGELAAYLLFVQSNGQPLNTHDIVVRALQNMSLTTREHNGNQRPDRFDHRGRR